MPNLTSIFLSNFNPFDIIPYYGVVETIPLIFLLIVTFLDIICNFHKILFCHVVNDVYNNKEKIRMNQSERKCHRYSNKRIPRDTCPIFTPIEDIKDVLHKDCIKEGVA